MKHINRMKRLFFAVVVLMMALSSCQSSKVKISGRFVGSDADMVYLEQNTTLEQTIIDANTDEGVPNFLYAIYNRKV